ncbi:hypothetical protein [Yoonia sediminilitoris]|uniref:Uncharacterized protein n=1 Tax=Yoonia sediminilitoris TaxID=1286148 RepID=A0A2T6K6L3_9RHOB|nr:hypothetical protein [Yoonia sediminilitoris]PUB10268.1 hypothetical protein C8N45_12030 [Yoonia sediminilitoris]RCW89776.1 hypothetical protein DFP92_12030 [Yoonia sediminilitoris]
MSDVFSKMRRGRLQYAFKREADRQAMTITEDATSYWATFAAQHIDQHFDNDEERGIAAEKAERALNPIMSALAKANGNDVSLAACKSFVAAPSVVVFPWTKATPD